MTKDKLAKLLACGETETVEFKERPNESFYKTISAFANTNGGTILLGIGKKGNVVGVKSSSKFLEDLTNRIVDKLSIYPKIEPIDMKDKRIIAVDVSRSTYPVSYEGRFYERVGNTTRQMNQEKLRVLLLRSKPWDSITGDFSLKEIDTEAICRFVHLAVGKDRLSSVSLHESPQIVLEKLGRMVSDKLTNGTVGMVEWMKEAGLPEPEYREEMGGFSVYFYKDIYTEENLRKMGLNDRQIKAVIYVKERGRITNKEYQKVCNTSERTASRDLAVLVARKVFEQIGTAGKGTSYRLRMSQRRQTGHKGAINTPNRHQKA